MVPCVISKVASSLNDSQMRPTKVRLKSLLDVPSSDSWHLSILMQMLRYFTDTQTGIQTATTDIFRQINPIFLFLRGCKVGPTCHFRSDLKGSPNSNEPCMHQHPLSRNNTRLIVMTLEPHYHMK